MREHWLLPKKPLSDDNCLLGKRERFQSQLSMCKAYKLETWRTLLYVSFARIALQPLKAQVSVTRYGCRQGSFDQIRNLSGITHSIVADSYRECCKFCVFTCIVRVSVKPGSRNSTQKKLNGIIYMQM